MQISQHNDMEQNIMNRLIKSAVFVLMATPISTVMAGSGSGCGVGQIVFEGQSGLFPNVLAVTTNGTFVNTFAVTSGTSGCDAEGVVTNEYQRKIFVASNLDTLSQEMAQGQGDHLTSLASLMGVSKEDQSAFYTFTQNQYGSLFNTSDVSAENLIAGLDSAMLQDPKLAKYVR